MSGKEIAWDWEYVPTKERIARAALRLFSRKGFKGTTIKDIAGEVGITEGAIYRHFSSKEEIISYLLGRVSKEIEETFEREVTPCKDIKTKIGRLVESLLGYAFENPDSFRFLTVYHILRENGGEDRLPGRKILSMLRRAYDAGEIRALPEVALSMIVGSIERLFVLRELGVVKAPQEKLTKHLKTSLVRAIL